MLKFLLNETIYRKVCRADVRYISCLVSGIDRVEKDLVDLRPEVDRSADEEGSCPPHGHVVGHGSLVHHAP